MDFLGVTLRRSEPRFRGDGDGVGSGDSPFLPNGLSPADLYSELKGVASALLSHEQNARTLQATALVHEVLVRMARSESSSATAAWSSPKDFIRLSVVAMHHVLADHARRKRAAKRGGGVQALPESMLELVGDGGSVCPDALAICEAIDALAAADARSAEVVRLRFFAGLSVPQVSRVLDIGESTVQAEWRFARAWLARELRSRGVDSSRGSV